MNITLLHLRQLKLTEDIYYLIMHYGLFSGTCRSGNGGCQHNCSDTPNGVQCGCAVDYLLAADKSSCIGDLP